MSALSASGWCAFGASWLLVGTLVGRRLHVAHEPLSTVLAAVPAWPLFLPVLLTPAPAPAGRVDLALDRLARALADAGEAFDLAPLRESLQRAEARSRRLDRLLLDLADAPADDLERLRHAKDASNAEIEAVLAETVRLRVQLGLAAVDADALPIRSRLAELSLRVGALDEVGRHGGMIPPGTRRYSAPGASG